MTAPPRFTWTPDCDQMLIDMRNRRAPWAEVGLALGCAATQAISRGDLLRKRGVTIWMWEAIARPTSGDERAAELRRMVEGKYSDQAMADAFGVSRDHIKRLVGALGLLRKTALGVVKADPAPVKITRQMRGSEPLPPGDPWTVAALMEPWDRFHERMMKRGEGR